jgi:hypothetical protein
MGAPSGHPYMHYTLKNDPRFLIVFPFFLPEPSKAFYKFVRVGKRSGAEGAAGIFFRISWQLQIFRPMYSCPR